MKLTSAGNFFLILIICCAAAAYYAYGVYIDKKKFSECIDPNLTFTLGKQIYDVPRQDIMNITLANKKKVWNTRLYHKDLPCNVQPQVHAVSILKPPYFMDIAKPDTLNAEQAIGTYNFFLSQTKLEKVGRAGKTLPDGVKKYSYENKKLEGDIHFYILPEESGTDAEGNPITALCHVREYHSLGEYNALTDQRCSLRFLADNGVFVDFNMLPEGENPDLLKEFESYMTLLNSYQK